MTRRQSPVTIIDVAREAGVSKSTAARVLAGNGSSSPKSQRLVTEAAERLGYRPNGIAKAMASGSSHTIGAVIPDVASPFFSAVMRGLTDASRAAGFEVIVSNTDNDPAVEARSLDVLTEKRVDGLVIAPVFQNSTHRIDDVVEGGTPVVLFDRRSTGALTELPLVSLDHAGASRLAVDHLVSLGHERIAIVTEATETPEELLRVEETQTAVLRPSSQRLLGYLRALGEHGIPVDPALILRSGYAAESASETVGRALDAGIGFTALYCTDSVLTLGAYRALVDREVALPEELSFVGFDDQEWTTLVRPEVTVVDQPRHSLGVAAAERLLRQIETDGEAEEDDIRLPASLIVRGSTRALR